MQGKRMLTNAIIMGGLAALGGWAISAQDKYTLKVPNGLAFSECRGDMRPGRLSPSVRTETILLRSLLTP
jgi:hypothetical protein